MLSMPVFHDNDLLKTRSVWVVQATNCKVPFAFVTKGLFSVGEPLNFNQYSLSYRVSAQNLVCIYQKSTTI